MSNPNNTDANLDSGCWFGGALIRPCADNVRSSRIVNALPQPAPWMYTNARSSDVCDIGNAIMRSHFGIGMVKMKNEKSIILHFLYLVI